MPDYYHQWSPHAQAAAASLMPLPCPAHQRSMLAWPAALPTSGPCLRATLPGAGYALQVDRWHYEIPGYAWDTSKLSDPKYPSGPEVRKGWEGMLWCRHAAGRDRAVPHQKQRPECLAPPSNTTDERR